MKGIIIGVDGGGTKTRIIIADEKGNEITSAEGPGSAVTPGAAAHSASVIAEIIRGVFPSIGNDDSIAKVLYAGIAGAGRTEESRALRAELEKLEFADEVVVESDAMIALTDAFGSGPGVMLLSGTGSIAFGRGPTGTFARCGGWGLAIGDEGSGAWIGRRALGIVAAASDGREAPTALTGAILTATQVNEVEELIPWSISASPADLAALAPVVFSTADEDPRAASLVSLAAEELVLHVRSLARQLFMDERADIPVALSGGLLQKGSILRKRVEQRLRSAVPGSHLRTEPVIPARGAIKAAKSLVEAS